MSKLFSFIKLLSRAKRSEELTVSMFNEARALGVVDTLREYLQPKHICGLGVVSTRLDELEILKNGFIDSYCPCI